MLRRDLQRRSNLLLRCRLCVIRNERLDVAPPCLAHATTSHVYYTNDIHGRVPLKTTSHMRLVLVVLCVGCGVWCSSSYGQTIYANSCSSSDVQAALNSVNADGFTVAVPSGRCTWTAAVTPPCYSLTLQGAGANSTHIIVNIPAGWGNDAIFVNGCSGKQFRITGFDWQYESADAFGLLMFTGGTGLSLRIDNNNCEPYAANPGYGRFFSFRVPVISPGAVIDHNTITDCGSIVENLQATDSITLPTKANGATAWTQPMPFESVNAVYYEDNTISNPSYATHEIDLSDCDDGGAYVYRYNTTTKGVIGNHGFDSTDNGCRMENVYHNTIDPQSTANWGIQYRGGTGVDWSNTWLSNAVSYNFGITTYRSDSNGYVGSTDHGHCDGTNSFDKNVNVPVSIGYHCNEQIGMGSGPNHGWDSQPLYEWDNCKTTLGCTGTGSQITATLYDPSNGEWWGPKEIVQSRDYYDSVSNFDGTVGVGIGIYADIPSTCTTGVGYWATDQQTLYQCNSKNTWTSFYQPFTYPHPLTLGPPPAAPSNLQATVQ